MRVRKHFHSPAADKWYEHKAENFTEYETATMLWDMPVNTDKEVKASRSVIINDKKEMKCIMLDIKINACLREMHRLKQTEKLSRYKYIEARRLHSHSPHEGIQKT